MPPFPNISRIRFTFDLDLSPNDLNIDRGHLFMKDFLPTKIEASGPKRSWLIGCTRCWRPTWPLTLTFDLLTWKSIGIIYSWRTVYLPSLKLLGQSVLDLSYQLHKAWDTNMAYDLDLWPTDLNINRDHLLIMEYLPTKFEASWAKCSWLISCTRCWWPTWPLTLTFDLLTWKSIGIIYSSRTIYVPSLKLLGKSLLGLSVAQGWGRPTYRPTDGPTDGPTCATQYAPPFSKGGINIKTVLKLIWAM